MLLLGHKDNVPGASGVGVLGDCHIGTLLGPDVSLGDLSLSLRPAGRSISCSLSTHYGVRVWTRGRRTPA